MKESGGSSGGSPPSEYDGELFFITPIGKTDSDERKRADGVRDAVIRPAASDLGLRAVRADEIEEGGHITLQVLEHCTNAKVAVADLTGRNLNVYYEVGIRHALRQALIIIADESERGSLPFDLLQQRTIFYTNDFAGAADCREKVTEQLRRSLSGHVDSPVQAAANLRAFEQGDAVERTLADLVTKVETLTLRVDRPSRASIPRGAVEDILRGLGSLVQVAEASEDRSHIMSAIETMAPALQYIIDHSRRASAPRSLRSEEALLGQLALDDLLQRRTRRDVRRSKAAAVDIPEDDGASSTDDSGDAEA